MCALKIQSAHFLFFFIFWLPEKASNEMEGQHNHTYCQTNQHSDALKNDAKNKTEDFYTESNDEFGNDDEQQNAKNSHK